MTRTLPLFALALALLSPPAKAWELVGERSLGDLPGGAGAWERRLSLSDIEAKIWGVSFSSRECRLQVSDVPPPTKTRLAAAVEEAGAIAGCNASYFHEDFRPLGLVISNGNTIHTQERAKLLSGILAVRGQKIELVRSSAFRPGADVAQAIQAGPWLLENGDAIPGLDDTKRARRTIVATDGKGRWRLLATSPVTLAQASDILASGLAAPGERLRDALNLDGGSSTALWARTTPPLSIPEFGYVRNFLLVFPKDR